MPTRAVDQPAEANPTLARLSQFIGGTWVNENPDFKIEFRYQWVFNKTAIRATGVIDKGGPRETFVESTVGWDPIQKTCYYLDFHGSQTVFKGTVKLEGDEIRFDFVTLIGPPAKWRSVGKLADDRYEFTIFADKNGMWTPAHTIKLKRSKS
jgi:hypothetical protein